jgi:protein-L-isoaspartate(D-aspartate) O-methyltransferase
MYQVIFFIISFFFCIPYAVEKTDANWWQKKATIMVINQLEKRGIHDKRVLRVMSETPRHLFIPENIRNLAYDDGPLPIGKGQTISQPYIVALMTELLELNGNERILEIGTGSGYQAAVLSPLVKSVYSIEIIQSLAESASEKLKKMQYHNVVVKWGDGYQGWVDHAPYDAIIVTAAPDHIPQNLLDQMKIGGRLVIPVGTNFQKLKVITRMSDGKIGEENIISVRFVPMVNSEKTLRDSSKFHIPD